MKSKKVNTPLLILQIVIAGIYLIVLSIPVRLFVSCTQWASETEKRAAEMPHFSEAERFAVVEKYMLEKYGVECIAVQDHDGTNVNWEWVDPVVMRLKDDPNGEALKKRNGQAFLDDANSKKRCNDGTAYCDDGQPYFLVFLDNYYEVIADQYMWYSVYPLLNEWMQTMLNEFAPAPAQIGEIYWCCSYEQTSKRNEGSFPYSFAPDFPVISNLAELEAQFPRLTYSVRLSAPEWEWWGDNTRIEWYPFEQKFGEYVFGNLKMSVTVRTSTEDSAPKTLTLYRRDAEAFIITESNE